MSTSATKNIPLEPSAVLKVSPSPPDDLPDEPLVTIEPEKSWRVIDFRELWTYRELLFFLTWRDVKVRYKQTLIGVAWAIMQPLLTMAIFTVFFGRLAGLAAHTGSVPYPIFALAGLLPWTFFASALTFSGNSLVSSANLITKVYFPRMIIPAAAVAAGVVDLAIAFLLFLGMMVYYRLPFTWTMLLFPVFVVLISVLALGAGMWLSALNVKYRDIRFALPFLIQTWMFVSPVIYPASMASPKLQVLLRLNPLTGIIEGYRSAMFGSAFDWGAIAISTLISFALLIYAAYSFRRMEKSFADIV